MEMTERRDAAILWTCNSAGSVQEVAERFGLEFFTQPKRKVDFKTIKTIEETAGHVVVQFKLQGGIKIYRLTGRSPGLWDVKLAD